MEKKASEILLDLDQKIDLLLGYVKTNDLNYKLIIARQDKVTGLLDQILKQLQTSVLAPSLPAPVINRQVRIPKPVEAVTFNEVDEDNKPILNEEFQPQPGRRDIRTPGLNKRKTQVQQKITYPDDKVVILAKIEIFDSAKNLVKETKTNSAGRWNASLEPGRYLASFLQSENFGPGRVIAIVNTNGGKPKNVKVAAIFEPLTPSLELITKYNQLRPTDAIKAGQDFVDDYRKQLDMFLQSLQETASKNSTDITTLLPFQDGDTLASWERANFTNYRKVLAPYLEKMGFEVVLN